MKKTVLATLLLSLAGSALAQNNPTFAQQLQQPAPSAVATSGAPVQNGVAPGANPMQPPMSGPVIYQAGPQSAPQQQAPQQQAIVQNGQVVQVPVNQNPAYQNPAYPSNQALPAGAAMALPPDSAPIPLPQLPSSSDQGKYFDQSLFNNTAMTPAQITELNRALDARRRALSELPNTAPRPVTGSIRVSLTPGSTPPLIRPFYGQVTSFVVVDNTGAPWPVENFRVGNSALFAVNRLDGAEGSTFTIDALDVYGQSNLVLKLAGLSAPVIIDLLAGQKEQDARVEVRVDRRGPGAAAMGGAQLPPGTSAALLPVLDGVTPQGGRPVSITGDDQTRAWLMPDGKMVVRTPMKIVSPASDSFVSSADGTNVYVFTQTPTLLGLYNGQFVSLNVTKGL